MELAAMVRSFVMGDGEAIGLPPEVQEILGGYRIRSRLGDFEGFPAVLDAGLADREDGTSSGLPYVTTHWVTGLTLEQRSDFTRDQGRALLLRLLEMLERLHREDVVYGDLKPGNVVTDDSAAIHLVDLDTLRKVPRDDKPTVCTHRTESWSAPEQKAEPPLLFLASDLYSFGLVAGFVLGGGRPGEGDPSGRLDGPWKKAVEACLRARPLDRPNTSALLAFLRGGGGELSRWKGGTYVPKDETVRVEDPSGPVDIPDFREEKPRPISIDWWALLRPITDGLKPLLRKRGPVIAAGLVLAGLLIGWGASALIHKNEINAQAQLLWAELETFKTVRAKHTEKQLAAIARRSDSLTDTGFALGVRALAKVWNQKWTYSSRSVGWSESRYKEGMRYVEEALQEARTPEALLALGLLHSGACRKMPGDQARERNEHCEKASEVLAEASRRNGTDHSRDWLEIEIQWTAVMSEAALGAHLTYTFDDRTSADRHYRRAFDRCHETWPRLPGAPVNSRELVQDCALVAGQLREFETYLEWSDWLIEYDFQNFREVKAVTKAYIVKFVDLECRDIDMQSKGPKPDPEAQGDITDLCRYFGLVALGCPERADRFLGTRQLGVPWDKAEAAAKNPARTKCAA